MRDQLAHANALFEKGRYKLAISFYEKISENKMTIDVLCNIAYSYLQLYQYDEAIYFCQNALQKDASCIRAYVVLSKVYRNTNNWDESKKVIQQLLTLDENEPEIHIAVAHRKFLKGEFDDTECEINKALELDPNNIPAHYFAGLVYEYKEDYKLAMNKYWRIFSMQKAYETFTPPYTMI